MLCQCTILRVLSIVRVLCIHTREIVVRQNELTHISRSFVAFRTRITHGAVDRVAGRSHDETFKLLGLQELDARPRAVHLN